MNINFNNFNLAEKIYNHLVDNGAEIANSCILIIDEMLPEDHSDIEDAKPLIGEVSANWQTFDEDDNTYQCTMCDFVLCLITGIPEENSYHYCPQCGTKMKIR